jgi:hypothetical protein
MFYKKAKRISALVSALENARATAEGLTVTGDNLVATNKEHIQANRDLVTQNWELTRKINVERTENTRLKRGIRDVRNKFMYYSIEMKKLGIAAEGHAAQLTKQYDL